MCEGTKTRLRVFILTVPFLLAVVALCLNRWYAYLPTLIFWLLVIRFFLVRPRRKKRGVSPPREPILVASDSVTSNLHR